MARDYKADPIAWFNGMTFEFRNYGTSLHKRNYLFKTWKQRIATLPPGDMKLLLLEHLADTAVAKSEIYTLCNTLSK